jgi:hypothetical protein
VCVAGLRYEQESLVMPPLSIVSGMAFNADTPSDALT